MREVLRTWAVPMASALQLLPTQGGWRLLYVYSYLMSGLSEKLGERIKLNSRDDKDFCAQGGSIYQSACILNIVRSPMWRPTSVISALELRKPEDSDFEDNRSLSIVSSRLRSGSEMYECVQMIFEKPYYCGISAFVSHPQSRRLVWFRGRTV